METVFRWVGALLFVFLIEYITTMFWEHDYQSEMKIARIALPADIYRNRIIPESTPLVFIGDLKQIRRGIFLYTLGENPSTDEISWESLGWSLQDEFSCDPEDMAFKRLDDDFGTLQMLHFADSSHNHSDRCRIYSQPSPISSSMEQTLLVGPSMTILAIILDW